MELNIQIQAIKSQIESMKFQIDNIELQNNNIKGSMMSDNPIGEQLLNLSMQMFNAGIQAFNIGKNISFFLKLEIYIKKIKQTSKQINSIINDYNSQIKKQQMMQQMQQQQMEQQMMQQQMMQEQMMQQQMMQQQMMQQQMMQQQMMQQQMMQQQMMEKKDKINQNPSKTIIFKSIKGKKKTISVRFGTTIEELLNTYINETYGFAKENIFFLYNAQKIEKNEQRFIEDYFTNNEIPKIIVLEF